MIPKKQYIDRFVPSRNEKEIELSQYLLSRRNNKSYDTPYSSELSKLLFGKDITIPQNQSIIKMSNPLKYKKNIDKYQIIKSNKPDIILNSPITTYDYYDNIIDISSNNLLAFSNGNIVSYSTQIGGYDLLGENKDNIIYKDDNINVTCLSFYPYNSYIISMGLKDGTILIYDIEYNLLLKKYNIDINDENEEYDIESGIKSMDWNGNFLLISKYKSVYIININNDSISKYISHPMYKIINAKFSPSMKYIGICTENGEFYLREYNGRDINIVFAKKRLSKKTNRTIEQSVYDFSWPYKNDDKIILAGNRITTLKVYNNSISIIKSIFVIDNEVNHLISVKNGDYIITSENKTIRIWNTGRLFLLHTINTDSYIMNILPTSNGDSIIVLLKDGYIDIWNILREK